MHERPRRYVRTTITLPQDLKRRMLRVGTVNWSAVACQAFEATLTNLLKQPGEPPMSDLPPLEEAIERLRRLKNLPPASENPRDFESGFQSGRRWAMVTATPQELGRLETFSTQVSQQWPLLEGKAVMKQIAQAVTGIDARGRPRPVRPALKDFWRGKVGLPEKPDDCLGFARGFCEGAMGFWTEAKSRI